MTALTSNQLAQQAEAAYNAEFARRLPLILWHRDIDAMWRKMAEIAVSVRNTGIRTDVREVEADDQHTQQSVTSRAA